MEDMVDEPRGRNVHLSACSLTRPVPAHCSDRKHVSSKKDHKFVSQAKCQQPPRLAASCAVLSDGRTPLGGGNHGSAGGSGSGTVGSRDGHNLQRLPVSREPSQ
eukprot:TRINITY_DN18985_c0_g1_i2.p1 TRINITY_DN18985_c0_g1~~TRINITY_DN18985_c0_g1_i2.p1  ORF type:complete len:122 (+),score=14.09 TRINITY_DN18985_c0_g1_i2:56-367(+)